MSEWLSNCDFVGAEIHLCDTHENLGSPKPFLGVLSVLYLMVLLGDDTPAAGKDLVVVGEVDFHLSQSVLGSSALIGICYDAVDRIELSA